MQNIYHHPSDPRSELPDHCTWEQLLYNCWHLERQLYFTLHGIRCGGAELTKTQGSLKLSPGQWTQEQWEDIKKRYLDSVREQLINMLRITRMGRVTDKEIPEQFRREVQMNLLE